MQRNTYPSILRSAFAALLLAAAAACSDDTPNDAALPGDDDNSNTDNLVTVRFSSGGGEAKPETRTSIDADGEIVRWKTSDKISISAVRTDDTSGTNKINKEYNPANAEVNSTFNPADGVEMQLDSNGTYTFYSYYPRKSGNTADHVNNFSLPEMTQANGTSSDHIGEYDFMWDRKEDVSISADGTAQVSFQYKHIFPMLVFNIKNANGKEVKAISVRSADGTTPVRAEVNVSLTDNSTVELWRDLYYYTSLTFTNPMGENGTGRLLILPQEAGAELTVSLMTTDNTLYEYTRTVDGGLQGGHSYSFTFDLTNEHVNDRSVYKASGTDTEWKITDKSGLRAFALAVNYYGYTSANAILTENISLSSYDNWEPIGTYTAPYSGTFNGQGYTVSGLTINHAPGDNVGLFGKLVGATVQNLRVKGSITTENSSIVGGIAGEIKDNSVIENCLFDGDVKGNSYVGGIVGYNNISIVTACFSSGNVVATKQFAGGIAGENTNFRGTALLENCYSKASVISKNYVGGIVGSNSYATVSSCYATGDVSAENSAGGISGTNFTALLENCLALGSTVIRTADADSNFGRVAGKYTDSNISGCEAWKSMTLPVNVTEATENGKDGADLTTDACKRKATYTDRGFDTTVWEFEGETFTTYLPWNKAFETFSGISEADYRIAVPAHLK